MGQHVLNFFWGELTLSEGAPFECLTPDGKSTVSVGLGAAVGCMRCAQGQLGKDVAVAVTDYINRQ